ncbi:MAG: M13 family metallopeptidase [Myxococcota bacterium]
MEALIGYPDKWRAYAFDIRRDDFAGNVLRAQRAEQERLLATVGKPVDRGQWQMTPPTVNAYYDSSLNQIVLPAGILQPPFFGATFHPAVNFGATGGSTVGHEMTHGFDDEGAQFDGAGNLVDWWSEPTAKAFEQATRCVVDQYGAYEVVPGAKPVLKVDGALTAGENIADIGGVKLGFAAYRAWRDGQPVKPPASVEGMSDDQLYFLSYGQSWCSKVRPELLTSQAHDNPHAPPEWRVNGVMVDQPGFAEAFQCKAGSAMNPGKRCDIW